jgi:hypothetical protein
MQTSTLNVKQCLTALGTVALLTACGGGGGGSTATTPTPPGAGLVAGTDLPTSVEQSAQGVVDFAKTQLTATSETTEPLVVGDAKLAVDDTAEPSDV